MYECFFAESLGKALKRCVLRVRLHFLCLLQTLINVKTLLLFIYGRFLLLDIYLLGQAILLNFKVTQNPLFLGLILFIPQVFKVNKSRIFFLCIIS